jgi:putative nucleotidyltransferase with HDIG domain
MGFFTRTEPAPVARKAAQATAAKSPTAKSPVVKSPVVARPPVVEGWSESELVNVYGAAPVKHLKKGEPVLEDATHTDSFFVLLDGVLQVSVKLDGRPGRPGNFRRGDCMAPLPKAPGFSYCAEIAEPATIIEITPTVMSHLPEKTQLSIFKVAVASMSKMNAYIRAVNGEVNTKNALIVDYIVGQNADRTDWIQSELVQNFMRNMPRLPAYATDLAGKLLDEKVPVQEVVEGIKRDPNVVGIVLKTVNSAQFAFQKKIESFYHACMILGFNNIHNLLVREAVQSTMPLNAETSRIHKHSCLMSVLCYEIASAGKEVQSQTATTIGLLHDIGKGVKVLMKVTHQAKADYVETFDSARLGAELLRVWELPERICKIVELQQRPEFTAPELMPAEYRRECATLHIAHALETLLMGRAIDPSRAIYTRDYMSMLGLSHTNPADLLKERVLPSLVKNRHRLPEQIHDLIQKASGN